MNTAIVCLTRGYPKLEQYAMLIERNKAIKKFFGFRHLMVLFHEGNIPESHQKHIEDASGCVISFVDVSKDWSGGYEGMCRFNTFDLWKYCDMLAIDYILRVDEDCVINVLPKDPFNNIEGYDILRSCYFDESHSETNATLPEKIEQLTGRKREEFYNRKFLYTNVYLSSVKFWMSPDMQQLLKAIACCDEQRLNRWGDLPVLGSLANLYAKVGVIEGLVYRHSSHNMTIAAH